MDTSYWQEFVESSKRVLLLQGPIGPFFAKLRNNLVNDNKIVYKINFNGGDHYYYPADERTYAYNQPIDDFYDYLLEFVRKHNIDSIVCFGHKREYHSIAKQLCLDLNKKVVFWVFEEGYLRPYYITFEKWGVNNSSLLQRDADFYLSQKDHIPEEFAPEVIKSSFTTKALISTYYVLVKLNRTL